MGDNSPLIFIHSIIYVNPFLRFRAPFAFIAPVSRRKNEKLLQAFGAA